MSLLGISGEGGRGEKGGNEGKGGKGVKGGKGGKGSKKEGKCTSLGLHSINSLIPSVHFSIPLLYGDVNVDCCYSILDCVE